LISQQKIEQSSLCRSFSLSQVLNEIKAELKLMYLSVASDPDQELWDEVVRYSDEGTIFHTWKWLKAIEKHNVKKICSRSYNGRLYPLMVWEKDKIVGLMPIFFYNSKIYKISCSPPYGIEYLYLGPVINKLEKPLKSRKKQNIFYQFHKTVDNFLKNELKSNYIRIISSPGLSDPRPFYWSGYQVVPQFTNIIPLRDGEKCLWENLSHDARNSINKAKKNGITVEMGSREDIDVLIKLLDTRDRMHSERTIISDILNDFFPRDLTCLIAKKDGKVLTGFLLVLYKKKVTGWIGTPKVVSEGISPNYLLQWECLRWAGNNNFDFFENLSANELSTFPFKSKFNTEIIPYYQLKWFSPLPRLVESVYRGIFPSTR
jgi:lipid II:glycine glycyltransferase (peptidoglycan interpeptide bridge formation enzyme)